MISESNMRAPSQLSRQRMTHIQPGRKWRSSANQRPVLCVDWPIRGQHCHYHSRGSQTSLGALSKNTINRDPRVKGSRDFNILSSLISSPTQHHSQSENTQRPLMLTFNWPIVHWRLMDELISTLTCTFVDCLRDTDLITLNMENICFCWNVQTQQILANERALKRLHWSMRELHTDTEGQSEVSEVPTWS